MFGFHANADRHAPLCLQENEIASAVWMKREDVSLPGYPTSVAAHLIGRFAKGEWSQIGQSQNDLLEVIMSHVTIKILLCVG